MSDIEDIKQDLVERYAAPAIEQYHRGEIRRLEEENKKGVAMSIALHMHVRKLEEALAVATDALVAMKFRIYLKEKRANGKPGYYFPVRKVEEAHDLIVKSLEQIAKIMEDKK